jgi:hypothetical protein
VERLNLKIQKSQLWNIFQSNFFIMARHIYHSFTMLNLFDLLLIKSAVNLRQEVGYSNIATPCLVSALERTLYLSGYALVAELMIFDQ